MGDFIPRAPEGEFNNEVIGSDIKNIQLGSYATRSVLKYQLRDWVFNKCENGTTPEEKLASLKIWKKLNSKPRSPHWSPVAFETKGSEREAFESFASEREAFEVDGQWYSVDVKKARNWKAMLSELTL